MTRQILILLGCTFLWAQVAIAEPAAESDDRLGDEARKPGASVTKERSRTVYTTKGMKRDSQYPPVVQSVPEYVGIELRPRRHGRDRVHRGKRDEAGRRMEINPGKKKTLHHEPD